MGVGYYSGDKDMSMHGVNTGDKEKMRFFNALADLMDEHCAFIESFEDSKSNFIKIEVGFNGSSLSHVFDYDITSRKLRSIGKQE